MNDWMDDQDDPRDEHRPCATEAEAHLEWHMNSGVPVGQPCPWDACHPETEPPEETYWEHEMRDDPPLPEDRMEPWEVDRAHWLAHQTSDLMWNV